VRARDKKSIDRILGKENILISEKVRFDVSISGPPHKGRVFCTKTRILLFRRTPMGNQITVVWYKDVENLTSGDKKGFHYAQLLGENSRILVLFKFKEIRDRFKTACLMRIPV